MDRKDNGPKDGKLSLTGRLRERLTPDAMFHDTEVQACKLGEQILVFSAALLVIIMALTVAGVFPLPWESVCGPAVQAVAEIAVLLFVCRLVRDDSWWLKPLLIFGIVAVYSLIDGMLTHKAAILMVIPVVFSCRFFSRKLTVFTSVLSALAFLASAIWGATHGFINLNIVTMPAGTVMTATGGFLGEAVRNAGVEDSMLTVNTLIYDYLPRWLMFTLVSLISYNIAGRGRDLVETQHEKDLKTARIESELNLATRIQAAMLPGAFPGRSEFDVFATMDPAKEVGGDFYDFFLIDDDHLYIAMADVSGKGVPAALFMMASKIVLANNAMSGKSPAQILTDTNTAICSNNKAEMFVTVWLGILEISTGKLTAANAGHEYPVLKRPGGDFELYRDRHGFVIGGMDGITYREYEIDLEPGSKLFLYTDGVPEAADAENSMFGTERMLSVLNADRDAAPDTLLKNVRSAVDGFVSGTEQFDDITMLCLEYRSGIPLETREGPEETENDRK